MEEDNKMLEEFQKELDKYMQDVNAAPREDMDNLSPNDMNFILYKTFDPDSPIQYKEGVEMETLNRIPFYKLFHYFIDIIQEAKQLKLTARGNLMRKTCFELYKTEIIKEEYIERGLIKLSKESDSIVLQNLKIIGTLSSILKKRNNKLSLTKLGEQLYRSKDQNKLFQITFETNIYKFNWGFHDGYPQSNQIQLVFGFSIYLLLRYGNEKRDLGFYVDKNLKAFPRLLEDFGSDWSTPEEEFRSCYNIRVFERLLAYYGFVEVEKMRIPDTFKDKIEIKATDLFREIFEIKKENFKFKKASHMS